MPRRRSGSFSGRSRAPQRQIANFGLTAEIDGLTTSSAATIKGAFSFAVTLGNTDAATLVRTRGSLLVRAAAAAAGDSLVRGAMGMLVISEDALAIGVTAIPGPLSDVENDWFVWVPFSLAFDNTLTEFDSAYFDRVMFDSRGMRKLKQGDALIPVLEVDSDVSGNSIDATISFRMQFKL